MTRGPLHRVAERLDAAGCEPDFDGERLTSRCPSHDDRKPSLTGHIGDDGRALIHCHAGCDVDAVLEALRLERADLFVERANGRNIVAAYSYVDEGGRELFQAVRFEPKDFRQRRRNQDGRWAWNLNGTRRVLYRLPQIIEAVAAGRTVYVVEGEKDVLAVEAAGGVATCNPMGAGKWRPEYAEPLKGASCIVVADKDTPGGDHARTVVSSLARVAASVRVVEAITGKDVADHLAAGHGLDELVDVELGDATEAEADEDRTQPDLDRPPATDVTRWSECASGRGEQEFVVQDLFPKGTVLVVTGEEGDGKTLLAEQLCRQLLRRDDVWGFFAAGDIAVRSALFVDTEMTVDDAWPRWKEAEDRGLVVEAGRLHWLNCGPLDLTTEADRAYVEGELERTSAEMLWIDAGGSAVNDPKDDLPVKAFFAWLQKLLRRGVVLAVGLTLHPRKRAQGEYGRRFDDLFGSRDWKGKATKVLYVEGERIVAWKDRGGHLGRRWPARVHGRFPLAALRRPGLADPASVPFVVEAVAPEPEFDAEAVRQKAIALVQSQPGQYSRTSLSEALGVRKSDAARVVSELLSEGVVGPNKDRAKLVVVIQEGGS